jgi:hypothetical protein
MPGALSLARNSGKLTMIAVFVKKRFGSMAEFLMLEVVVLEKL